MFCFILGAEMFWTNHVQLGGDPDAEAESTRRIIFGMTCFGSQRRIVCLLRDDTGVDKPFFSGTSVWKEGSSALNYFQLNPLAFYLLPCVSLSCWDYSSQVKRYLHTPGNISCCAVRNMHWSFCVCACLCVWLCVLFYGLPDDAQHTNGS